MNDVSDTVPKRLRGRPATLRWAAFPQSRVRNSPILSIPRSLRVSASKTIRTTITSIQYLTDINSKTIRRNARLAAMDVQRVSVLQEVRRMSPSIQVPDTLEVTNVFTNLETLFRII